MRYCPHCGVDFPAGALPTTCPTCRQPPREHHPEYVDAGPLGDVDVADVRSVRSALGDQYLVDRRLGGGQSSFVYGATEIGLGRQVALKVLRPPSVRDAAFRGRFREEAVRLSRLASQGRERHFPTVYGEVRAIGELTYLPMALIEGPSLRAWLRDRRTRDEQVEACRNVIRAVAVMHAHGFVHRDLKPENIILRSDPLRTDGASPNGKADVAVIVDFGLARDMGEELTTSRTAFAGTFDYSAPEQRRKRQLGDAFKKRADVYSLGVILAETLGRLPERGMDLRAGMDRLGVGDPIIDVLARCIREEAADRYHDANEVESAFAAALSTIASRRERLREREREEAPVPARRVFAPRFYAAHGKSLVATALVHAAIAALILAHAAFGADRHYRASDVAGNVLDVCDGSLSLRLSAVHFAGTSQSDPGPAPVLTLLLQAVAVGTTYIGKGGEAGLWTLRFSWVLSAIHVVLRLMSAVALADKRTPSTWTRIRWGEPAHWVAAAAGYLAGVAAGVVGAAAALLLVGTVAASLFVFAPLAAEMYFFVNVDRPGPGLTEHCLSIFAAVLVCWVALAGGATTRSLKRLVAARRAGLAGADARIASVRSLTLVAVGVAATALIAFAPLLLTHLGRDWPGAEIAIGVIAVVTFLGVLGCWAWFAGRLAARALDALTGEAEPTAPTLQASLAGRVALLVVLLILAGIWSTLSENWTAAIATNKVLRSAWPEANVEPSWFHGGRLTDVRLPGFYAESVVLDARCEMRHVDLVVDVQPDADQNSLEQSLYVANGISYPARRYYVEHPRTIPPFPERYSELELRAIDQWRDRVRPVSPAYLRYAVPGMAARLYDCRVHIKWQVGREDRSFAVKLPDGFVVGCAGVFNDECPIDVFAGYLRGIFYAAAGSPDLTEEQRDLMRAQIARASTLDRPGRSASSPFEAEKRRKGPVRLASENLDGLRASNWSLTNEELAKKFGARALR